jgi:uracil-DNA glycosylase
MNKTTVCHKCDICASNHNNPVWGFGNESADIMFIGEAPGSTERKIGIPFVGAAGRALRTILDLYGFNNSNIYVTNIIKCRPPNNRDPEINEIINCVEYLVQEITTIKPKIIVLLGNTALHTFYNNFSLQITKYNGKIDVINNRVIIPMYHPSYLLRNPEKLWEFEIAMNKLLYLYRLINPMHITKL